MAFEADRLRALRDAKGFSQGNLAELANVSQSVIQKIEKGGYEPGGEVVFKLACALDCPMDYFYGRGQRYKDVPSAAVRMAFDVFAQEESVTNEQRERCLHACEHPSSPRTAEGWRVFSEMMELAVKSTKSRPKLSVVKQRPPRAKPTVLRPRQ